MEEYTKETVSKVVELVSYKIQYWTPYWKSKLLDALIIALKKLLETK